MYPFKYINSVRERKKSKDEEPGHLLTPSSITTRENMYTFHPIFDITLSFHLFFSVTHSISHRHVHWHVVFTKVFLALLNNKNCLFQKMRACTAKCCVATRYHHRHCYDHSHHRLYWMHRHVVYLVWEHKQYKFNKNCPPPLLSSPALLWR